MAKKSDNSEPALFPREDKEQMLRLFKIAALSSGEVNQIFELYRKYVNPNQPFPATNCGNCPQNISVVFSNLREWLSNNFSKFEE